MLFGATLSAHEIPSWPEIRVEVPVVELINKIATVLSITPEQSQLLLALCVLAAVIVIVLAAVFVMIFAALYVCYLCDEEWHNPTIPKEPWLHKPTYEFTATSSRVGDPEDPGITGFLGKAPPREESPPRRGRRPRIPQPPLKMASAARQPLYEEGALVEESVKPSNFSGSYNQEKESTPQDTESTPTISMDSSGGGSAFARLSLVETEQAPTRAGAWGYRPQDHSNRP